MTFVADGSVGRLANGRKWIDREQKREQIDAVREMGAARAVIEGELVEIEFAWAPRIHRLAGLGSGIPAIALTCVIAFSPSRRKFRRRFPRERVRSRV